MRVGVYLGGHIQKKQSAASRKVCVQLQHLKERASGTDEAGEAVSPDQDF